MTRAMPPHTPVVSHGTVMLRPGYYLSLPCPVTCLGTVSVFSLIDQFSAELKV